MKQRIAHHKNLIQKGASDLGLVISAFQQGLLLWLVLRDLFPKTLPKIWVIPVVGLCVILITAAKWLWGWFYERSGLYSAELSWITERNPEMQKVLRKADAPDN